VLEAPFKLSFF